MRGTYTLLLVCKKPFRVRIGSLGYAKIGKGYYLYTGSALGEGALSLEGRLKRHSRPSKGVRWHVDYLISHPRCKVKAIVCLRSRRRLECFINQAITRNLRTSPILPHAGSSDCECYGHLLTVGSSIGEMEVLRTLMGIYGAFGKPTVL